MGEPVYTLDLGAGDVHTPGGAKVGIDAAIAGMRPLSAQERRDQRRAERKAKQTRGSKRGLRLTIDHPQHGRFEIRHMANETEEGVWSCSSVALDAGSMAANDDAPVWNQIAVVGEYHGHPMGSFRFDRSVFERIIQNFKRNPDNTNPDGGVVVDWEHASEQPPEKLADGGAPAAGWIRDLAIRGNALWAAIKWQPKARAQVRSGEYKRISPAVAFRAVDPKTKDEIGPELRSAGLTNGPFLQGMRPLAARRDGAGVEVITASRVGSNHMATIRTALSAHPMATMSQVMGHLDGLREMLARADGGTEVDGVDLAAPMSALRTMANVPITCSDAELLDIVEDLISEAIEEHEARFHEGEEPASMSRGGTQEPAPIPAPEPPQTKDTTPMADQNEVTTLSARVTSLESENATLKSERAKGLEAQAEVTKLSTKVSTLEAQTAKDAEELRTLRAEVSKRDAVEVERDVDEAIADHGTKNPFLCSANRDALIAIRKNTPTEFLKIAPKLKPEEKRLLTRQVPERPAGGERSSLPGGHAVAMTAVQLAKKMVKDDSSLEKVPFDDVIDMASRKLADNPLGLSL